MAPDTVPVLLTAYERFDVAREAFGLGVHDYLVKPVDQDTLVEAIRSALDAARARKAEAERARNAVDALERTRALLEIGFLDAALHRPDGGTLLPSFAAALGLPGVRGPYVAFARRGEPGPGPHTGRLRNLLGYRRACVVGAQEAGTVPVFFPGDREAARAAVLEALRDPSLSGMAAGIGQEAGPAEARSSWLAALGALSSAGPGEAAAAQPASRQGQSPSEACSAVLASATAGDTAGALAAWGALARSASVEPQVKAMLQAATAGAASWVLRRDPAALVELAGALAAEDSPGGTLGNPGRQLAASGRIAGTLRYMEEHLAEPLSLEELADRAGLSPAHLARLLAAETGRSFTDHLSDMRIARAKAELASGRLSVKEIGAATGYADPNYFSRAFKRATGLTPSEYAKEATERP